MTKTERKLFNLLDGPRRLKRSVARAGVWPVTTGAARNQHRLDANRFSMVTGLGKHKIAEKLGVSWRTVVGLLREV